MTPTARWKVVVLDNLKATPILTSSENPPCFWAISEPDARMYIAKSSGDTSARTGLQGIQGWKVLFHKSEDPRECTLIPHQELNTNPNQGTTD